MRPLASLVITAAILAGCAAPTADWKPLRGQDGTQRERDWAACQPVRPLGREIMLVLLAPYIGLAGGIEDHMVIFQCMEQAGYEWSGRSPRE